MTAPVEVSQRQALINADDGLSDDDNNVSFTTDNNTSVQTNTDEVVILHSSEPKDK